MWKYKINKEKKTASETKPVIDKFGNIFFGTHNGTIVSLNKEGGERWIVSTTAKKIYSDILLIKDKIIVLTCDAQVLCLSTRTGKLIWRTKINEKRITGFWPIDFILYLLNIFFYAYKKRQRVSVYAWSNPVLYKNNIFISCRGRGLNVLDLTNGHIIKSFYLGFPSNHQSSMGLSDNLFIASQRGRVTCVDENYTKKWSKKISTKGDLVGGLLADSGFIYATTYISKEEGYIVKLDQRDGSVVWKFLLDSGFRSTPVSYSEESFILHGSNGVLYEISKNKGDIIRKKELYDYRDFGQWSTPAIHKGLTYVPVIISPKSGGIVILNNQFNIVNEIVSGKCLGTPVFTGGKILYSSWDGYFVCDEIK